MDHGKPIIYVKNVRKVYRMGDEEVVALKRINLRIYKGEVCCIFGTSGSGKSTLLNQLAGMEKPTKGQVFIRGKNISDMNEEELAAFRQEHMSFIFQSYNLLPSMTAVENVAMPLMFKGMEEAGGHGRRNAETCGAFTPASSLSLPDVRGPAAESGNSQGICVQT